MQNIVNTTPTPMPSQARSLFEGFYGAPWKNSPLFFGDDLASVQFHTLLIVEAAYRTEINLDELLAAYAKENRGGYRTTLRTFAQRVKSGMSIIDALEQTPDVLPPNAVIAIRHGVATSTLPETFEMLKEESSNRRQSANHDASALQIYWLVVGIMILAILIYISKKITPSLQKIMSEFGQPFSAAGDSYNYLANLMLISLPWIVLGIILLSVTGLLSMIRSWIRRTLLPHLTFTQDLLSSATLLRLFAIQLRKNASLTNSLSILAKYHNRKAVRAKLLIARNENELGMDIWKCLQIAKLLTQPECKAVQQASDSTSQAWILSKLAQQRDHRANLLFDRFVVILTPALTLLWGAIVAWTALVVFLFVCKLVVSLS